MSATWSEFKDCQEGWLLSFLPSLRRGTAAATTSVWPDNRIHGPIGCGSKIVFFSPSNSTLPKRAPPHSTPRQKPSPAERISLFGEGREILASGFRSYVPPSSYFQEKVRSSVDRNLFPSPRIISVLIEHSPSLPSFHSLRLPCPIPYSACAVSPGLLRPTFSHYKA